MYTVVKSVLFAMSGLLFSEHTFCAVAIWVAMF